MVQFCVACLRHVSPPGLHLTTTRAGVTISCWFAEDAAGFSMECSQSWETPSVPGKLGQLVTLSDAFKNPDAQTNQPPDQLHQSTQVTAGTVRKVCCHVPSSSRRAVLRKSFLFLSAVVHAAQLLWALQTAVPEWWQAVLSFRRALGSCHWQRRARHHSQCFGPGRVYPHTCHDDSGATVETPPRQ